MSQLNKLTVPSDDQFFEAETFEDIAEPPLRVKIETFRKGATLTLRLERFAIKTLTEHVIGSAQMTFAEDNQHVFLRIIRDDGHSGCEWTINPFSRDVEDRPYYFVKRDMLNFPIQNFSGAVNFQAIEGGILVVIPKAKQQTKTLSGAFWGVDMAQPFEADETDVLTDGIKYLPKRTLSPLITPLPLGLIPAPLSKVTFCEDGNPIWTIDTDHWLLAYMTQGGELKSAALKLGVTLLDVTARYASIYRRMRHSAKKSAKEKINKQKGLVLESALVAAASEG